VSTACARPCASTLDSGRPLLPLAISRSTKQKRFQSLKQASLIGLSAMLARGVLFEDGVDFSEIATTLFLAMYILSSGYLADKSLA